MGASEFKTNQRPDSRTPLFNHIIASSCAIKIIPNPKASFQYRLYYEDFLDNLFHPCIWHIWSPWVVAVIHSFNVYCTSTSCSLMSNSDSPLGKLPVQWLQGRIKVTMWYIWSAWSSTLTYRAWESHGSFPITRPSKPLNNSGQTYGNLASCKTSRWRNSREFLQAKQCWRESLFNSCYFPCNKP